MARWLVLLIAFSIVSSIERINSFSFSMPNAVFKPQKVSKMGDVAENQKSGFRKSILGSDLGQAHAQGQSRDPFKFTIGDPSKQTGQNTTGAEKTGALTMEEMKIKYESMKNEVNTSKQEVTSVRKELARSKARLHEQCKKSEEMSKIFLRSLTNTVSYQRLLTFNDAALSSTYNDDGIAAHAIDGNHNTAYPEGFCAHTDDDANAWWLGALTKESVVTKVVLTNRQDCCSDRMSSISVQVFESDPRTDTNAVPKLCGSVEKNTSALVEVVCERPLTGKYLRVFKGMRGYMSLCEVEAYGHSTDKPFGLAIQTSEVANALLATDDDVKTCSETENEADTWWQVDLLKNRTVRGVAVTNRDDEKHGDMSDFEVSVYNTFPSCIGSNQTVCAIHKGTVGQGETVTLTCDQPMSGRYMRIRKLEGGALSLCDVRLLG